MLEHVTDRLSTSYLAPPTYDEDAVRGEAGGKPGPIATVGTLRVSVNEATQLLAIADFARIGHDARNPLLNFPQRMDLQQTSAAGAGPH